MRIRTRITFLCCAMTVLSGGCFMGYSLYQTYEKAVAHYRHELIDCTALSANRMSARFHDPAHTSSVIRQAADSHTVVYACVMSVEDVENMRRSDPSQEQSNCFGHDRIEASNSWITRVNQDVMEVSGPVRDHDGQAIGYLKLAYGMEKVNGEFYQELWSYVYLLVAAFAFGPVCAWLSIQWLVRPIETVARVVDNTKRGNLDLACASDRVDEVGDLANGIEELLSNLRSSTQLSQHYLRVMDAMGSLVFVVNDEGDITFSNSTASQVLGYSERTLLSMKMADLIEYDDPFFEKGVLTHLEERGSLRNMEKELIGIKGELIHLVFFCSAIPQEKKVVYVAFDLTDRRELELELFEAYKAKVAAEHAVKARSQFVANMSHELRTPLNAIIGYSEMMLDECEDEWPDSKEDLERIRDAGKNLLAIVSDILEVSRIDAGRIGLNEETLSLKTIYSDFEGRVMMTCQEKGLKAICENRCALDHIHADEDKIRRCLGNLIHNACKFTNEGSVSFLVDQVIYQEKEAVQFTVRDTGIGLSEEEQLMIFGDFTQVDVTPSRKYGGTGLGLAICRRFCQLMGGTIEVNSQKGKGTEFLMIVPYKPSDLDNESLGQHE